MASDHVEIAEYDPGWPRRFEAEAERLRDALAGCEVRAIEHFGSTAVPGLAAKPVIDMLLSVPGLAEAREVFPGRLAPLGYVFWADNPATDRLFFVRGMPPHGECRTHHLHVTEPDGAMWEQLLFRDYLRAHPTEAASYAVHKRELAIQYSRDREAYTQAKAGFIETLMDRARAWSATR